MIPSVLSALLQSLARHNAQRLTDSLQTVSHNAFITRRYVLRHLVYYYRNDCGAMLHWQTQFGPLGVHAQGS